MFSFQKEAERNGLVNSHSMSKFILFFFAIQSFGPKFKFQSADISSNFILYFSGTISFARWSVLCKNSILWGEDPKGKSWERLLCPPPLPGLPAHNRESQQKEKSPFSAQTFSPQSQTSLLAANFWIHILIEMKDPLMDCRQPQTFLQHLFSSMLWNKIFQRTHSRQELEF